MISARNQFKGKIQSIKTDGLMGEVVLKAGDVEIVSIITRESVERLGLKVGQTATAIIKSTEVMIAP